MAATSFVEQLDLPSDARNVILHTRMATQGSPENNHNNHPIITGNIVGVHNGVMHNDYNLFQKIGPGRRIAQVDTEAIFAAIAYGLEKDSDGKHLIAGSIPEILNEISGSAAIAWQEIDGNPTTFRVAKISGSPFVFAQTPGGSFIFASEAEILNKAAAASDVELLFVDSLTDGTLMEIDAGKIVAVNTWEDKTPTKKTYTTGSGYVNRSTNTPTQGTLPVTTTGSDESMTEIIAKVMSDSSFHSLAASHGTVVNHLSEGTYVGNGKYDEEYVEREASIDRFMKHISDEPDTVIDTVRDLHGFVRPGNWVMTGVGNVPIVGQIVSLPQAFPYGEYMIKGYFPINKYDDFDTVLVSRSNEDFIVFNQATQYILDSGTSLTAEMLNTFQLILEDLGTYVDSSEDKYVRTSTGKDYVVGPDKSLVPVN